MINFYFRNFIYFFLSEFNASKSTSKIPNREISQATCYFSKKKSFLFFIKYFFLIFCYSVRVYLL